MNVRNDGTSHRPHLSQLIERIERMEEEKQNIMADIREIYAEAKAKGYDPKIMRKVVEFAKTRPCRSCRNRGLARYLFGGFGALGRSEQF